MSRRDRNFVDEDLVVVRGELRTSRVFNDFWTVAQVLVAGGELDGRLVSAVGKLVDVRLGDTVELRGVWERHPKHGEQLKVRTCDVLVAQDKSGAIAWIAARLPDVGRARAGELVERFGIPGLWDVIEKDSGRLTEIDGITVARACAIAAAYQSFRGERDRMVRLRGFGMTDAQIARAVKLWGEDVEKNLRDNPYRLSDEVAGFGFKRADDVALRMELPRTSPARIRAGLVYTMLEARGKGHVYVRDGLLVGLAAGDVCLDVSRDVVWPELTALVKEERLVALGRGEKNGARIYLAELARAEALVGDFVRRALAPTRKAAA